jgi:CheY-like chemotaxis protein
MPTILIVEDDTVLGGVLQMAFRNRFTVEQARDASEALGMFDEARPDIVLTDKNMPGMTGVELLRALRERDPTVGVVVMTAYGTVESASEAFDLGVDAYIEKPFPNLPALVREMERLCEKVAARRVRSPRALKGDPRVFVATPDAKRRAMIAAFIGSIAALKWFDSIEELVQAEASGECDATVVDCVALNVDAAVAVVHLHPELVPCIVVADSLTVPEITRLIDLAVTALIDGPLDDARSGRVLERLIDRIRHGTA